jgi:hypothetical protein
MRYWWPLLKKKKGVSVDNCEVGKKGTFTIATTIEKSPFLEYEGGIDCIVIKISKSKHEYAFAEECCMDALTS